MVKYRGPDDSPCACRSLVTEARVDNLHEVLGFVSDYLEVLDCPPKIRMQMDIAVEELFVNIAHYAYPDGTGKAEIRLRSSQDPKTVEIELRDSGIPYDPTKNEDPDVTLAAEDRDIGGLGVFMVRQYTDGFTYRYENGQNILTIRRIIE